MDHMEVDFEDMDFETLAIELMEMFLDHQDDDTLDYDNGIRQGRRQRRS